MKKVINLILLFSISFFTIQAQEIAMVDHINKGLTTVKTSINTDKGLTDITAVETIRHHIMQDRNLQQVVSEYVDRGRIEIEVAINSEGLIVRSKVIHSLSRAHDIAVQKSILKLRSVDPIVINGQSVSQKVRIPILFK